MHVKVIENKSLSLSKVDEKSFLVSWWVFHKVGCGIPDDDGHQPVAKGHLKDSGDLQTAIKAD